MADAAWYDHLKLNKGALLHASYNNKDLLQNDNWWRKSSRIVHEYLATVNSNIKPTGYW
jgi:hypothetical protein